MVRYWPTVLLSAVPDSCAGAARSACASRTRSAIVSPASEVDFRESPRTVFASGSSPAFERRGRCGGDPRPRHLGIGARRRSLLVGRRRRVQPALCHPDAGGEHAADDRGPPVTAHKEIWRREVVVGEWPENGIVFVVNAISLFRELRDV